MMMMMMTTTTTTMMMMMIMMIMMMMMMMMIVMMMCNYDDDVCLWCVVTFFVDISISSNLHSVNLPVRMVEGVRASARVLFKIKDCGTRWGTAEQHVQSSRLRQQNLRNELCEWL